MIDALKSQFFKGKDATDAQLAVVVSIAKELRLNPLIPGQLYPYPDRSGSVTVMIGPDGIYTMLANNPDIVAQKDGGPAFYTEHGIENGKETCTGYINHKIKGLLKKTIWVDEWVVASNPNWSSRRHHMAEIRALKQAARMIIHGIPADNDERVIGEMMNVTPENEAPGQPTEPVTRPEPPKRSRKGAAAVQEAQVVTEVAATQTAEPAKEAPKATPEQIKAAKEVTQGTSNINGDDVLYVAPTKPFSEPTANQPRAFLQDGEKLDTEITVADLGALNITTTEGTKPSVKAKVTGGFVGEIYHIDGGVTVDGKAAIAPPWSKGAVLKAVLLGKLNNKVKNEQGGFGKVQVFVQSVEPAVAEEGMEA